MNDTSITGLVRTAPKSPYWRAITAESTLAAQQVAAAGPALDDLDPARIGSFYAAFFPLSIGYERMAKIALHVDTKITTGDFISTKTMRTDIGHRLNELFDRVAVVCERRGYKLARPAEPIHEAILSILTEFATTGRYNHLDTLGSSTVTSKDAEYEWDQRVLPLLTEKHLKARMKETMLRKAAFLGAVIEAGKDDFTALVIHHDVSGEIHTDLHTMELVRDLYRSMNPWGRMYALQLGRWLAEVLHALSNDALKSARARDHVPYLIEFFGPLTASDSLLRTRRHLMRS
ncbi:hypothetical protein KHQ06_33355 [Nocardia tengchongensis]|uniref:Uncharacterized protein n=1 Tax=Nocardia tengchongensis TaxID=2055889 RepID=A0ABX8CLY8_9NOCA|nr:hypothetical protein [Nocardia tengchongensis]QVI20915.1 hypothetical protein KHQ06_33355 [Nocardia tengchongensis]